MTIAGLPEKVSEKLPALRRSGRLHLTAGDTFIHAPGFEDRTMAFGERLSSDSHSRAILIDYRPYTGTNRLADVRNRLHDAHVHVSDDDILEYDRFNPGNFQDRLLARLKQCGTLRAIIDISTMSKLAIMLVLQVCHNLDLDVHILYSEAKTYSPSKKEFEEAKAEGKIHRPTLHVFNGIHGVVRVDALASVAMQGQPTAAIVFMSFNDALTQLLLNTVYPGRLLLINGRPPVHSWREAATAWVHDQVRKEWERDNPVRSPRSDVPMPQRVASTLDYRESVSLLLTLYWQLSANHRVLLAPSGSKMQTVACYLVKGLHPDIHIEYPSPEGFAREYSSGIGTRWSLKLGSFKRRMQAIEDAERHAYLELAS